MVAIWSVFSVLFFRFFSLSFQWEFQLFCKYWFSCCASLDLNYCYDYRINNALPLHYMILLHFMGILWHCPFWFFLFTGMTCTCGHTYISFIRPWWLMVAWWHATSNFETRFYFAATTNDQFSCMFCNEIEFVLYPFFLLFWKSQSYKKSLLNIICGQIVVSEPSSFSQSVVISSKSLKCLLR